MIKRVRKSTSLNHVWETTVSQQKFGQGLVSKLMCVCVCVCHRCFCTLIAHCFWHIQLKWTPVKLAACVFLQNGQRAVKKCNAYTVTHMLLNLIQHDFLGHKTKVQFMMNRLFKWYISNNSFRKNKVLRKSKEARVVGDGGQDWALYTTQFSTKTFTLF